MTLPSDSETSPKSSVNMPQRIITLGLVLAMLAGMVLALTGCPHRKELPKTQVEQKQDQVAVFFTKSKGAQSVTEAVVRPMPEDKKITPIQYALTELLKGPSTDERKMGYFTEIPKGTELLSVKKEAENVTVDFSDEFSSGGGSNSVVQRMNEVRNTIISASKDATQEPLKINIMVNGKPLQTLGGEGLEVPQTANQPIQ